MEIYAIINRKGGVAKTTTAQTLAAGLNRRGIKTLLIDLDSQANLTFSVGADKTKPGAAELLMGAPIADTIQHTDNGDIIAAKKDLAAADYAISGTGKEYRLKEILSDPYITGQYNAVVLDTPAALNVLTVNAMTAATQLIIPVNAEPFNVLGMDDLIEEYQQNKKYFNKDLKVAGVLLNNFAGRDNVSKDMAENLAAFATAFNTKLFNAVIPSCCIIPKSQAKKCSVFDRPAKSNNEKNTIAAYEKFIDELLKG